MKKYYIWEIHQGYARYWTKESLDDSEEFGQLFDKAETYLSVIFNPNNVKHWNPPLLKEAKDEGLARLIGDMHSTWMGGIIVSQNMVDKLGYILKSMEYYFL